MVEKNDKNTTPSLLLDEVGMKTQEDYPIAEKWWKTKTIRLLYICCI